MASRLLCIFSELETAVKTGDGVRTLWQRAETTVDFTVHRVPRHKLWAFISRFEG